MDYSGIACDWMTLRHDYPFERSGKEWEAGRIVKIDRDGVIEFETRRWDQIRCASSDTSIRIKCDGQHLWASGNIGRFQQADNITGLTVMQCFERWADVLEHLGLDMRGFGSRFREGFAAEYGTYLTRLDLAGNFDVSDYPALCSTLSIRRIGQRLPMVGKYGPTWGYDSKRSNWTKAKLYDKTAEAEARRRTSSGATLARFEVQLGSEYLKRHHLDTVISWKDPIMSNIVYGRFADQVFTESVSVEDWSQIPPRLRQHAILWRDGIDLRGQLAPSTFRRVRGQLRDGYGIDIGTPCNVVALTRQVRVVEVTSVSALRVAA